MLEGKGTLYRLYRFKDIIRIPPERFGEDLEKVALELLRSEYEGVLDKELGLILTVTDVSINPEGYVIPGDGATYHEAEFTLLAFVPLRHEVIEGVVDNVTKFGLLVNIGPVDGLVHRSQIGDDKFMYDPATGAMVGTNTNIKIKKGDMVRAKIVQVSYTKEFRIGLTMRQPYLGKIKSAEEVKK